jgi:hypothetical protein
MVIVKILALIVAIILCVLVIKYREPIVRMVGKSELAERYMGPGGTYTMWVLVALLLVVAALVWLVGLPG